MFLASNKNVILDKTKNAWVPKITAKHAEKQVATVADGVAAMTNIESNTTEVYITL